MQANWFRPGGLHEDVPLKLLEDGQWLDTRMPKLFEGAIALVPRDGSGEQAMLVVLGDRLGNGALTLGLGTDMVMTRRQSSAVISLQTAR